MYGTVAKEENTVCGTVAIIRSKSSDLDQTAKKRPNSRYCSHCSKFRESHSDGAMPPVVHQDAATSPPTVD
jgi:hypothetical protein